MEIWITPALVVALAALMVGMIRSLRSDLEKRIDGLDKRIDETRNDLGKRIDGVDKRIDETRNDLGKRIDDVDKRIDGVEKRIDETRNDLGKRIDETRNDLGKRIDAVEDRMERFEDRMGGLQASLVEVKEGVAELRGELGFVREYIIHRKIPEEARAAAPAE